MFDTVTVNNKSRDKRDLDLRFFPWQYNGIDIIVCLSSNTISVQSCILINCFQRYSHIL